MAHVDDARSQQGLAPLPFGAALHLGEMLWGNIGAADRLDFTAISPAVNLVSRLEGLCRPLGKTVLVSGAVRRRDHHAAGAAGRTRAARIAAPCAVFTLPDA
jgi:adenylate cyclase